jgi:hypothetical protein
MDYLWKDGLFRITDSLVSTSNGGDALLFIESAALRMRFTRDRDQLFLEIQPLQAKNKNDWYSTDLLYRLLEGGPCRKALLDKETAQFVENNIKEIEKLFQPANLDDTVKKLKELKRIRAKELFG